MAKTRARLYALARFGSLLALLGLALALVFSAWAGRRDAIKLSVLLERAQADSFFRPVPPLHQKNRGAATSEQLAELVDYFGAEGLRYMAEFDPNDVLVAEAGQFIGPSRPAPTGKQGLPIRVGERVQATYRPPRHAGVQIAGGDALPTLVMQFEPLVASELRSRANKSFIFSLGAAFSLFALTLGLGLALAREERNRQRNEREHHLAALGEMSAVMAHEIRNPLASLKGHAQLLGEQLDAESPLQKKVVRIVDEAKRLEELTTSLLDLVRSSAVEVQAIDPGQLVRDVAQAVDARRIRVEAASAPASWSLDPLRMQQVLRNLFENALQASGADGVVEAEVTLERGKLVMRVRDHGKGLPEGAEQRIFEPFHTTRTQGTGLGLAVARRIVEQHGGQIQAENHPQGGALFTLRIPD
jgi:two-component system, NtrC family, sensor histidine kinase HydH